MYVPTPLNNTCRLLIIPHAVRYLPDWLPGTEFKALAEGARQKFEISRDGPMEYVKTTMKVCPQSDRKPKFARVLTIPVSPARHSHHLLHPTACLDWRITEKRASTRKPSEICQALCLAVSLAQTSAQMAMYLIKGYSWGRNGMFGIQLCALLMS